MAEKLLPDVVLMDTIMPGLNGIEATRQIRRRLPKTKVLMLTGYMEDEHVAGALKAGASGYVIKKSELDELLLGIQAVHRGNPYFSCSIGDGDLTDYLWQLKSNSGRVGYDLLTAREREVLQLIAEGASNQKIAEELYISVKTVEAHRAHIMTKLHAKNRTDLIRYALRKGLVGLDAVPVEDDAELTEASPSGGPLHEVTGDALLPRDDGGSDKRTLRRPAGTPDPPAPRVPRRPEPAGHPSAGPGDLRDVSRLHRLRRTRRGQGADRAAPGAGLGQRHRLVTSNR